MAVRDIAETSSAMRLIEGVEMSLWLTYEGPLPGEKKHCRGIKHQIRKQIHQQLKELIEDYDHTLVNSAFTPASKIIKDFYFAPLVVDSLHMICELDITFRRREKPGSLITKPRDEYGGDLDNRLKIFFDALRMPQRDDELPEDVTPEDDEHLFYCLLEDDALITRFQVETAPLLGVRGQTKDIRIDARVTIKLTRDTKENRVLIPLLLNP